MFLQVAQASYNNNEKPDQSAVLSNESFAIGKETKYERAGFWAGQSGRANAVFA